MDRYVFPDCIAATENRLQSHLQYWQDEFETWWVKGSGYSALGAGQTLEAACREFLRNNGLRD